MAIKTYAKGSAAKLSEHFKVSEFACHGSGCCTQVLIDERLVEYLQKIRDHFGKSVTVTSGYRCATHNKSVNGATSSYHMKGQAADIVVSGTAPAEVAKYAESIGVLGIGLYDNFVHIDTRTSKYFWYSASCVYRATFGGAATSTTSGGTYDLKSFVKDVQAACGVTVDGVAGPQTLGAAVTLSSRKNPRHGAVKAVQKYLAALGYAEVGAADGIAGAKFTSAVAHFQQDQGLTTDGIVGTKTWGKLLGGK